MKSITIHNLDDELAKKIEELSQKWGLSLNKTIKRLLRKTVGLDGNQIDKDRFKKFVGTWSDRDAQEFAKSQEMFQKIDEDIWK